MQPPSNNSDTSSISNENWNASVVPPTEKTTRSPDLEAVLNRLNSVAAMVEAELEPYRQASIANLTNDDGTPLRTDYILSIVIPVYNELATIGRVISRVAALPLNTEILLVDDCSADGTREILKAIDGLPNFKVILKEKNAGKGAALRTGFEQATGDFVIVQDADLEYNPRDIPQLLVPLLKGEADIVYGSRFIGEEQQDKSWVHRFGNAVLTNSSNLFSGLKLTDMETCYKVFTREAIKAIEIEQNRFGIEPEITAKLARRGYRFVEVPITYQSRGYDEGKKIGVKDLFNAFYCIGRYGVTD